MSQIQCVGVVGAGTMGMGIAEVIAAAGIPTIVVKATAGSAEAVRARLEQSLAQKVATGKLAESSRDEILGRTTVTGDRERLGLADLVIEAIVEDLAAKRELFASLDATLPESTIFASNTQALRIGELARDLGRASRVIGMHFFAPAQAMKLVEVIHLADTRADVVAAASELVARLGKTAVPVLDSSGFVVNRLLVPYLLDAMVAYEQGLARPDEIDTAMRLGCGHPVGPLALADLIGLDVVYTMAKLLHAEFHDARYQPPALLRRMVQSGQLGKKTELGFFDYATSPARVNEEIWNVVQGGILATTREHAA